MTKVMNRLNDLLKLMNLFADDDDEHSYHFRGKPELLAGISEENLLEQLEIEYLGDITSCNKVSFTRDHIDSIKNILITG